jgi:PAS domain S-box-containing protein
MSTEAPRSLMDFMAAPILVGDPDGRAVYVNPCFEREFGVSRRDVTGVPLASLFEGGGREAVLDAVARVCGGAPPARFRLRAGERGYAVVASAVEAEGGRVGVVLLLTEETSLDGRLSGLRREVLEPLDEVSKCLTEFSEQTGGRRDDRFLLLLADAARALDRMRKWAEGLAGDSTRKA